MTYPLVNVRLTVGKHREASHVSIEDDTVKMTALPGQDSYKSDDLKIFHGGDGYSGGMVTNEIL